MTDRQLVDFVLDRAKALGADYAQCTFTQKETKELNVDGGVFSLFRTLFDNAVSITVLVGGKKGTVNINSIDEETLTQAVEDCISTAEAGESDPAWQYCDIPTEKHFTDGTPVCDTEKLFDRTKELLDTVQQQHPTILLEQMIVTHVSRRRIYRNTYGVQYTQQSGEYGVDLMFSAHEGEKSSSFFGSSAETVTLDVPFITLGSIADDLQKVEMQLDATPLAGKFVGKILLTPSSLNGFLDSILSNFASDSTILDGTSPWKDKLGQKVADERITLASAPLDDRIVCGERFTGEGFVSENYDILRNGVLNSFMISNYAANKTGNKRSPNTAGNLIMQNGTKPLAEMLSGIDKGIWVGRFSGGNPGTNGDFSGVAKNSFLIENGKITVPLSETMISGNLADLLCNLTDLSSETVEDGASVLPYALFDNVTVAGK